MKIEKQCLASFDKLYAQGVIWQNGEPRTYLAASEAAGPCVAVDAETLEVSTLWQEPGGTMVMVQLNDNGDFIANQRFLPVFAAADCRLVYGKRTNTGYEIAEIQKVPYLHRFDILDIDGTKMLIGATLCGSKESQQDWSKPGTVYVGLIPEDPAQGIQLKPILQGITKNHGFCTTTLDNRRVVLVSGVEGLYAIYPPMQPQGEWVCTRLMDREISDVAVVDIDNDGQDEIAVIEGFHGDSVTIQKRVGEDWQEVYRLPVAFGHALWGGELLQEHCFLAGWRRGTQELVSITCRNGKFNTEVLANGGSAQLTAWQSGSLAHILSADREAGEAVLYTLTK